MEKEPTIYVQDLPTSARRPRWPYAVLAAAAFAAAITLGPSLLKGAGDADGSDSFYAAQRAGRAVQAAGPAATETTEPAAATVPPTAPSTVPPTPEAAPEPSVTSPPSTSPQAPAPPAEEPAAPIPVGDGRLKVDLVYDTGVKGTGLPADGDEVIWTLVIENSSEEYLWGVYGYLEGYGPVPCESRRLDVGESTSCTATNTVWESDETATAWATAWTLEEMVEAETIVRIEMST
jgi:hypothetical protein